MRPWKPLEKGGGAGEKAWQSLVRSIGEETVLGSKPPIPYGRKVWEEAIEKGEIPFDPGAVPLALLKRTVLRKASKAAVRGRKGFVGTLRKEFDKTARSLFRTLREFPEKAFEPLEEVGFPKKILDPTFGEVRGLVSYGPRSKPWLKMQVALASKHIEEIAHTARHEMTHVGQIAARKQWYEPVVEMERTRRKLFRETPTLEPIERWKLDPTERHAEMFAEVMGRILKKRAKQGPLSWEEYRTIFRETIPAKFLPPKASMEFRKLERAMGAPPSPQVTRELPRFGSTEEALEFGARFQGEAKVGELLRKARKESLAKTGKIRSKPRTTETMQEAMDEAIQGQFFREALEELEGRFPKELGKVPSPSVVPTKRPYQTAPDELMGFRKMGEQKGYFETAYRHEQKVRVKFPGEKAFSDQIKGLNKPHALERARRNWPGAKITPGWGE